MNITSLIFLIFWFVPGNFMVPPRRNINRRKMADMLANLPFPLQVLRKHSDVLPSMIPINSDEIPQLAIICQVNCGRMDVSQAIVLKASCTSNCNADAAAPYVWIIYEPRGKASQESGRDHSTLTIPPLTLTGGQNVTIFASKGRGHQIFNFFTSASCHFVPDHGDTQTPFFLACNYVPGTSINIYQNGFNVFSGVLSDQKLSLQEGYPAVVQVVFTRGNTSLELQVWVKKAEDLNGIWKNILGSDPNSLPTLMSNEDYEGFISKASLVLSDVHNMSNVREQVHALRHVAAVVTDAAPRLASDQLLAFLFKAIEIGNLTDGITLNLLSQSLEAASHKVLVASHMSQSPEPLQSGDKLFYVAAKLFKLMNGVVVNSLEDKEGDYPSYDYSSPVRVGQIAEVRQATDNLMDAIEVVGRLTDRFGNYFKGRSDNINTTTVILPWRNATTIQVGIDYQSAIQISNELANHISYPGFLTSCHVVIFNKNPIWWQNQRILNYTDVVMVNMNSASKEITELGADIDIMLKRSEWKPGSIEDELSLPDKPLRVYRLNVSTNTNIMVKFSVVNFDYYGYVTKCFPSLDDVRKYGRKVTRANAPINVTMDHQDGMVYMAIARKLGTHLKFKVEIGEVGCAFWDDQKWDTSSCTVGPNTTDNMMHCRCRHLSLFTGTFFVPPYEINEFSELPVEMKLGRSALVLGVLCGALVVWGLLMVWAASRDAALQRRRVHRLVDVVPGDSHPYLVGVTTGLWQQGTVTTARVAMQLLGTESNGRVHILNGNGILHQGAEDWFVVLTPQALGEVRAIRFYHDSYGANPHWYIERVEVRDLMSRRKYKFKARKWLSLIWGDGKVERIFSKLDDARLRSGAVIFPHRVLTDLRDNHIWLSVLTRPLDSTYTSKERVAVGAAVMLLALLVSALFYDAAHGEDLDPEGSMAFSGREVAIMLQTVLIIIPFGVVVATLFRRSLPIGIV